MQTSEPAGAMTASIIVPCFNQLEFTRQCVAALYCQTAPAWELIVVDNGSTDGTAEYLRGVRDASAHRVEVVTNPENRGFPAACNQGLTAAKGDYLVLLNNDAVVTDAWLEMLIALADSDPSIGMVGPMSNYATPPQLVESVPYHDLEAMHRFASQWRSGNRGKWQMVPKLSGFCVLIKRAAFAAVGGLDERFGLGFFDDDDLALRMRQAGYQLAIARDLFIHHYGSRTFAGAGIDAGALLAENQQRFSAKWGAAAGPAGRLVSLSPWSGSQTTPARAGRPKVSLTMIVRDEEANLPSCLKSATGLFDEIVVVDTGSTDGTIEIARSFGAQVFEFAWIDDFAAARNEALSHATGDYVFWLDADDVIEPAQAVRLRRLLDSLDVGDPVAYVVRCSCDADGLGGGATEVDHVRLFPLRAEIRWAYRVHEQILPSLRRVGVPVKWSDVTVRHTGYVNPAIRGRKLDRDQAILEAELSRDPSEPFVLFNLGGIALERSDWRGALDYLRRSLAGSAPTDSIVRKLHALIAKAHQSLGEPEAALSACSLGLGQDPDDAELLFRKAILHRHLGANAEAEACWRRILGLDRPEKFSSVDVGIYGHLTRRNLARMVEERGDLVEASRLWGEVLAECPGDREAVDMCRRLNGPLSVQTEIPGYKNPMDV